MYPHGHHYKVNRHARCLEALVGDSNRNRFLIGTNDLREANEIHLIDFDEDSSEFKGERVFHHEQEIWHLAPSPHNPSFVWTCANSGKQNVATLWHLGLEEEDTHSNDRSNGNENKSQLQQQCQIPDDDEQKHGIIKHMLWSPRNEEKAIVHTSKGIQIWNLDASKSSLQEMQVFGFEKCRESHVAMCDPHHDQQVTVGIDSAITTFDCRQSSQSQASMVIPQAHGPVVRDIDYNPNRPHILVSAGDDCQIKFWDARSSGRPLKTISEHTHWIWSVKYNRFHDQLVLSGGSDCLVNLWRMSSVSSAPHLGLEDDSFGNHSSSSSSSSEAHQHDDVADKKICSYADQHHESVYATSWSASDSWIFASLSYDGHCVLNHIPSTEKYKILL